MLHPMFWNQMDSCVVLKLISITEVGIKWLPELRWILENLYWYQPNMVTHLEIYTQIKSWNIFLNVSICYYLHGSIFISIKNMFAKFGGSTSHCWNCNPSQDSTLWLLVWLLKTLSTSPIECPSCKSTKLVDSIIKTSSSRWCIDWYGWWAEYIV